jgi:hypothetical protein
MLVYGHPRGLGDESCLLEGRTGDAAEFECEGHDGGYERVDLLTEFVWLRLWMDGN